VEKGKNLGGGMGLVTHALDYASTQNYLKKLVNRVKQNKRIEVFTEAELVSISGFIGNYSSVISSGSGKKRKEHTVDHGVIILATGGHEHRPEGYLLDKNSKVITQQELEKRLAGRAKNRAPDSVVMIQCAGSRGDDLKYCSKVCCSYAVKNALKIKEINPDSQVIVLYRDMRTYGFAEDAYREARLKGVIFIPYELEKKPEIYEKGRNLHIRFFDSILQEEMDLTPDLVALSVGIVPDGTAELSKLLKAPLTDDRFFLEAHVKLRPVELAVDGVYVCGIAHGPKPLDEIIAQAQAAAAKAAIPLVKGHVSVEPIVSRVNEDSCIGCSLCATLCPYKAIEMKKVGKKRKAETISASCKACGICASHCPTFAISMGGFTNEQITAQIEAFGKIRKTETAEVE
jgi:heterodisulfide reductase subunit A